MPSSYSILLESCFIPDSSDMQVISESKTSTGKSKTVFKTILQTIDEVNQNGRIYPMNVAKSIVRGLKPIAENRSLFQEIDHPASSSDPQTSMRRAATVELKNSGALIRKVYIEGNRIMGEFETLSGFRGPDLRDLILVDKANIGFSLRMLGRLSKHPTMENVTMPADPMRPITYDVVTNPSHSSARVISITNESALSEMSSSDQSEVISESCLIQEGINLPDSTVVDSFMKDIVLESFNSYKPLFSF